MNKPPGPRWHGHQRRIGLTGGIATGKSSVGSWLAAQGLPVLDADQYAREALSPGSPGACAVVKRYGNQCVVRGSNPASAIVDRPALGEIVFNDTEERHWLEELVHPMVRQRFETELQRLADEPVVVLMIPLLFEAGLENLCSEVWLVECNPTQQLERLMARNGLSEAEALLRIQAQWPLQRKQPLADQRINNAGSQAQLADSVLQALAVNR